MANIAIFVEIQGVGTGDNAAIGMVAGNLQWCSKPGYSGWKSGMIDHKTIDVAPMSCNVASGGCLGGFDGSTSVTVVDGSFWSAYMAGNINLQTRNLFVYIGDGVASKEDSTLIYSGKISSVSTPNLIKTEIVCDGVNSLDLKKLPSIVITKEMALNNEESDAIGKSVVSVYGNRVFYPLIYCKPSDDFIGFIADYNGFSNADLASIVLFNASSAPIGTGVAEYIKQITTPDLSFAKGKSLLQCVGAWQSSSTSPVWVCFSYNGKELLAASADESAIDDIANAIVGKRMVVAHGAGKNNSYKITSMSWATHEISFANWSDLVSVETIWFELDTTSISEIKYSVPTWSATRTDTGNAPLFLSNVVAGNACVNALVGARGDSGGDTNSNFLSDVSYFAFQLVDAGLFIVSADADTDSCEIYQKTDSGYTRVTLQSGISVVYSSDKWKLISLEMASDFGDDAGSFLAMEPFDSVSYLYENKEGTGFGSYLNSLGIDPNAGGIYLTSDATITSQLTALDDTGITLTNNGDQFTVQGKSQNTVYIPFDPNIYDGELNVRILPTYSITFTQSNYLSAAYNINLNISVFVIGEGNIAIAKRTFEVEFRFNAWASEPSQPELISIDHSQKAFVLSSNCSSHEAISKSAYALMESALTVSSSEIPDKKRILGFVVSIFNDYEWVAYNSGIKMHGGVTKVIKKCKTYFSKKADMKNLWLKSQNDSTVDTPAGLVRSICDSVGISYDSDEFAAVEAAQRLYYATESSDFDGEYIPDGDESISDVIDSIGKGSLTGFYTDASGVLRAKFLPSAASTAVTTFNGDDIKKNSLSVSTPHNGYLFSDYDFSIPVNVIEDPAIIAIDTDGVDTFPTESATEEGAIVFNAASGYTISVLRYFDDGNTEVITASVRGSNSRIFAMFIPGTVWKLQRTELSETVTYICRVDNVAPDIGCPIGSYGIRLCMKVL